MADTWEIRPPGVLPSFRTGKGSQPKKLLCQAILSMYISIPPTENLPQTFVEATFIE